MSKNNKSVCTKKTNRINNKRWTDQEVNVLLQYLQEQEEFEKPTAQIFYREFLNSSKIDANWNLVRWKVKHLKTTYIKARTWSLSNEAKQMQKDLGEAYVQEKLRKICRFYDDIHKVFANRVSMCFLINEQEEELTNMEELNALEIELDEPNEFCGFEDIEEDEYKMSIKLETEELSEESFEIPTSSSTITASNATHADTLPITAPLTNQATEVLNSNTRNIPEYIPQLIAPTGQESLDPNSRNEEVNELNSCYKLRLDFDREKFKMEFALKKRRLEQDIIERTRDFELKKLKIESDERLEILKLEKEERMERLKIESRYKAKKNNGNY